MVQNQEPICAGLIAGGALMGIAVILLETSCCEVIVTLAGFVPLLIAEWLESICRWTVAWLVSGLPCLNALGVPRDRYGLATYWYTQRPLCYRLARWILTFPATVARSVTIHRAAGGI